METSKLGERLVGLREERGWSLNSAARQTTSVNRQTLANLEGGKAKPWNVPTNTAMQLIDLYWPSLVLGDFCSDSEFERYEIVRRRKR